MLIQCLLHACIFTQESGFNSSLKETFTVNKEGFNNSQNSNLKEILHDLNKLNLNYGLW